MEKTMDFSTAGVDEVGVGPLAGPVIAAAVILDPACPIEGLRDSKQLSEKQRLILSEKIHQHAWCVAIGRAEPAEIDTFNILQARLLAMQRAVLKLSVMPQKVLVDGNQIPKLDCLVLAIVGGDKTVPAISAASIVAKVARDAEMIAYDEQYPGYGFAKHKGYPTAMHRQALARLGLTPLHRRSFKPVSLYNEKIE